MEHLNVATTQKLRHLCILGPFLRFQKSKRNTGVSSKEQLTFVLQMSYTKDLSTNQVVHARGCAAGSFSDIACVEALQSEFCTQDQETRVKHEVFASSPAPPLALMVLGCGEKQNGHHQSGGFVLTTGHSSATETDSWARSSRRLVESCVLGQTGPLSLRD